MATTNLRAPILALAMLLTTACATTSGNAEQNFDTCLITNMAAVEMLNADIAETEEFLTRARMTAEAYQSIQSNLARDREAIANLLARRAVMLRDDHLDDSEQAARTASLMRAYSAGADAAIAKARADEIPAADLAAIATSCAESLAA